MEQVEYQYQDGYLDVLEYTEAENQFGNYFKQCLVKEGVNFQRLETKAYQLMLDEREFDPPASPRPDSPAWAYMYGNNLVDFKTQMENLTPDKEFKRGFFKHRVEALEKKLRMHFPQLDWQARYERRKAQWANDKEMSTFASAKAEELAKAVAQDQEGYIAQYRSNGHFDFGPDDPFEYYMPASNEEKWLNHQKFEWDQTSRNADHTPYMEMLQKLEQMLEPKLKGLKIKEQLTALHASDDPRLFEAFNNAIPSTTSQGNPEATLAEQKANMKKAIDTVPSGRLVLALTWGNLPDLFAPFFVKPGTLDSFISDNEGVLKELATSHAGVVKASTAMDKAITAVCNAAEKACEANGVRKHSGVAAFLANGGLQAAAEQVNATPEASGLAQNLTALATSLKNEQNSFLGYVHCMAAASVVSGNNLGADMYNRLTYGPRGASTNVVAQAAVVQGFADAVGNQVAQFLSNSDADLQGAVVDAIDLEAASEALNTARQANDNDWKRLKLDYALADMASLSIQYKY